MRVSAGARFRSEVAATGLRWPRVVVLFLPDGRPFDRARGGPGRRSGDG